MARKPVPITTYPAEWLLDIYCGRGAPPSGRFTPYLKPYQTDDSYREVLPAVQRAGYLVVVAVLFAIGLMIFLK